MISEPGPRARSRTDGPPRRQGFVELGGAVRRQISQFGSGRLDELLDPGSLVARQIVHDDDVAFGEGGHKTFFHPFLERGRVDRPVEGLLRHEAAKAQAGDERNRLVMAVRNGGAQSSAAPTASAFARHIRRSPGLIDEHEASRIEIELPGEPVAALSHNVRALLLLGVRGLLWNGPPLLPAS